ncbi:hypothetical protein QN224_11270 [Sinorhizobium sp. 8-89]|uniref:hypothetical protein n=1 Tax=Sinorhizobium sp. 7-81 TaxID=3049087 RepID=UPI0024C238A5|nr:hypothetical protein [Sinorhizobium sp. 7-81]MDK1385982.1 hypothetical protein [Sinorhizobium sp. 7-81]
MTNSQSNFPLVKHPVTASLVTVRLKQMQLCPVGIAGVQDRVVKFGVTLSVEGRARRRTRLEATVPMQFSPAVHQEGAPA